MRAPAILGLTVAASLAAVTVAVAGWTGARGPGLASQLPTAGVPPVTAPSPPAPRAVHRRTLLGHSTRGRPIWLIERAAARPGPAILVVGCIHGVECAGFGVTDRLLSGPPPARGQLWVIPNINPDGYALGVRGNARGVDLNRNFPSEWRPIGVPGDPQYAGPHPLSEREDRLAVTAIQRVRPTVTLWFHQPQDVVRAWGQSIPVAQHYARLAGARFRRIRWPSGSATNWQNHHFPGTASFVVELAPGPLPGSLATRYAGAIRRLL